MRSDGEKRFVGYLIFTALVGYLKLGIGWAILPWLIYDGCPVSRLFIFEKIGLAQADEDGVSCETESATWLNTSLQFFWDKSFRPFIDEYFKEDCPPILTKYFVFVEQFDIGENAPQLESIVAHTSITNLSLELGLNMDLNPKIDFSWFLNCIRFGLKKLKVKGLIRLKFKQPIVNDVRMFGKLQATFVQMPQIDYEFTGVAMILNYLKPLVRFLCSNFIVYPNSIELTNPLTKPMENLSQWKSDKVVGALSVKITALPSQDVCTCFGLFNPLAFLELGNHITQAKMETSLIHRKKFPIWADGAKQLVIKSVTDMKMFKFCKLSENAPIVMQLSKLQCFNGCIDLHGRRFHLETKIEPVKDSLLTVFIIETSSSLLIEPQLILQMTGSDDTLQTEIGLKSNNWRFYQVFAFFVDFVATDKLAFTLVNAEGGKKTLAQYSLRIADLEPNCDKLCSVKLEADPGINGEFEAIFVAHLEPAK